MSWETMIDVIDQTTVLLRDGNTEAVRDFLQRLTEKKISDRRTWGRISFLAQDTLLVFDSSNSKKLLEVLKAMKAIAIVAQKA